MAVPAGYTQIATGWYMKTSDGSGPYVLMSSGAMQLWDPTRPAGEMTQVNRTGSGAISNAITPMAADGIVHTGPAVFYGFQVTVGGTTPTLAVYDGISAGGDLIFNPPTANIVVGAALLIAGGAGRFCSVGVYFDFGGAANCTVVPLAAW